MKKHAWRINSTAAVSLQDFLAERLQLSRNRAKGLIDARMVFVNGRRVWMARHRLRSGDLVETAAAGPLPPPAAPAILYDARGLLAVDKPPGILSNGPRSLEELLRGTLARPGLQALHRLDRDTTGCLLFTDDPILRETVIRLFAEHRVIKVYHAIVGARPGFQTRSITLPVDGQAACTNLRVLDAGPQCAHLQLSIATGRTHQIRRHLEALRLPLLGERVYNAGRRLTEREMRVPRQMLHARRLVLTLPGAGAPLQIEAPLPADFRGTLRAFHLR